MKAEIKDFLAIHAGVPLDRLTDDLDLFENNIWDSLLIVRFVNFAEQKFNLRLDLASLREEKIKTIDAATRYLEVAAGGE